MARKSQVNMTSVSLTIITWMLLWWTKCIMYINASPTTSVESSTFSDISLWAPYIKPVEQDITLDAGSSFTLTCESSKPIVWKLPVVDPDFPLAYTIEDFLIDNGNRPYGSKLNLHNVSAYNVGYYFCLGETPERGTNLDELVENYLASKIYIFVNDPNHLIVPFTHPIITAFRYSDAVIPCKPTSRNVEVLLANEAHSEYIYEPMNGIKLLNVSDSQNLLCVAKNETNPDLTHEIIYHLVVQPRTKTMNQPKIQVSQRHAFVGDTITLNCSVDLEVGAVFEMQWTLPESSTAKADYRANIDKTERMTHPETHEIVIGVSNLTLSNVQKTDTGTYICMAIDHFGHNNSVSKRIDVLQRDINFIEFLDISLKQRPIESRGRTKIQIPIKYKAYPKPRVEWYNNRQQLVPQSSDKYEVAHKEFNDGTEASTLEIKHPELLDTGEYHVKIYNSFVEKQQNFTLHILDKPSVDVQSAYIKEGQEALLTCDVAGYPPSKITWSFTPCSLKPRWPNCDPTRSAKAFKETEYKTSSLTLLAQQSELRFTPSEPGIVACFAVNKVGNDTATGEVLVGDLEEPFHIYGVKHDHKNAVGDSINLTCGAIAYNYTNDLNWFYKDELIQENAHIKVVRNATKYSYRSTLQIKSIKHGDGGLHECRSKKFSGETESKYITLNVYDPQPASIEFTNLLGETMNKKLADLVRLECKFTGIPEPTIEWTKDGEKIKQDENSSHINFLDDNTVLEIPFVKPEDQGLYRCSVFNRVGRDERTTTVKIPNLAAGLSLGWILSITVLILILVLFIIYLYARGVRERKVLQELKNAGLANFEQGALECLNPALSLDEQAEYLPYNKSFEFPPEKLKLGKQLGAGAFGVVVKAVAENILRDEKETTVAVKMVKKTANNEVMRALVSELKIMVHLGKHLNVVNLLGAVTKNIAKREVMVIVEYCRYGNVQNFLLKNRKRFINQINPETDQIDPCILTKQERWSTDYEYNSKDEPDSKSKRGSKQPNSKGYMRHSDYYGENINSCNTEQTLISNNQDATDGSVILSNNSVQPAWRSNYKPDCVEGLDITTTNLVSWAFQVARGMDYLASKKVLHGDLAARNILLCDDNVVKICDFGLARSMISSENYKKQGEAPLPIKWLALESLGDRVFSTYSDVWSFGIVLWEFFSLAKVPYPGMEADQTLYLKLKDGYRMEKPEFANQELYDVMLHCWNANPESRPLFDELQTKFARMLEDDITNHYLDLNEPYLKMNEEFYSKQGQSDYLAIMGCPNEEAPRPPSSPPYVNGNVLNDMKKNTDDKPSQYLHMSPSKNTAQIFSPRPGSNDHVLGDHFTFPSPHSPTIKNNLDSPIAKNRKKTAVPEEIPMLKQTHSDSETELSPDAQSSHRNFDDIDLEGECETILAGNENYINMPTPMERRTIPQKDAFSNPGYSILTSTDEKRK